MSKNAATESDLGALHSKVAKVLTGALEVLDRSQEVYMAQTDLLAQNPDDPDLVAASLDLKAPELNASLLSVMTKFLADNKISCAPEESTELTGLASILKQKGRRRQIGNVTHLAVGE